MIYINVIYMNVNICMSLNIETRIKFYREQNISALVCIRDYLGSLENNGWWVTGKTPLMELCPSQGIAGWGSTRFSVRTFSFYHLRK